MQQRWWKGLGLFQVHSACAPASADTQESTESTGRSQGLTRSLPLIIQGAEVSPCPSLDFSLDMVEAIRVRNYG